MDASELIKETQEKIGRIIISCDITPAGLENIRFLPYAVGDYVLDVWDMRIGLCRVIPAGDGHGFIRLLDESHSEGMKKWLYEAFDAAGGFIGRSGHYPVVIPFPDWLEVEIALSVLRK